MLRTMVADAKRAGHNVTTILDQGMLELKPVLEADHVLSANSLQEAETLVEPAAEKADASLVIAPESGGKLQTLVEKLQKTGTLSLNCSANAIKRVSDKAWLRRQATRIGLLAPETMVFSAKEDQENIVQAINEKIGFPAILKPTNGVGCETLSIAKNVKQAKEGVHKIVGRGNSKIMAQKLVAGTPASVALISNGKEAQPIILNKQTISLNTPWQDSSYDGGATPLTHKLERTALTVAKELVESVEGLKGYVGVDLVLTENEPVVIEINPRLTTSYVGIREVVETNLAQVIIAASLNHEIPPKPKPNGYAYFEKVKMPNSTNVSLFETFIMPEIVSPPFPIPNESQTYSLICTKGSTPQLAKRRFNKGKKHLRSILIQGGRQQP